MAQYMTEQRKKLISFLESHHDRQFSARDIASQMGPEVSVSAVYRNLSFLQRQGYISRAVKEGSNEAYYQYIKCEGCKNRVHLTCTRCGRTAHMDKNVADSMASSLLDLDGFEIIRPKTVIYGICRECKEGEE